MICHPGRKKRGTLLDNSDTHYMLEHSRRGDERINGDYMQGVRGEKGVKTRKRERVEGKRNMQAGDPCFFPNSTTMYTTDGIIQNVALDTSTLDRRQAWIKIQEYL